MKRTLFALAFFGLTLPTFGQGVDPYIGTWKMNLEKTTIIGAPVPKSYIMTITADGPNLSTTVDVVGVPQRRGEYNQIHADFRWTASPSNG